MPLVLTATTFITEHPFSGAFAMDLRAASPAALIAAPPPTFFSAYPAEVIGVTQAFVVDAGNLYAVLQTSVSAFGASSTTVFKYVSGSWNVTGTVSGGRQAIFYDPAVRSIYISLVSNGSPGTQKVQVYDCASDSFGLLTSDISSVITAYTGAHVLVGHTGTNPNSGIFLFFDSNKISGNLTGVAGVQYSGGTWGSGFTVVTDGVFGSFSNQDILQGLASDLNGDFHVLWIHQFASPVSINHVIVHANQTVGSASVIESGVPLGGSGGVTSTIFTDSTKVYVAWDPGGVSPQPASRLAVASLSPGTWTITNPNSSVSNPQVITGVTACLDGSGNVNYFWILTNTSTQAQQIYQNMMSGGVWGTATLFYDLQANPPANWDGSSMDTMACCFYGSVSTPAIHLAYARPRSRSYAYVKG